MLTSLFIQYIAYCIFIRFGLLNIIFWLLILWKDFLLLLTMVDIIAGYIGLGGFHGLLRLGKSIEKSAIFMKFHLYVTVFCLLKLSMHFLCFFLYLVF